MSSSSDSIGRGIGDLFVSFLWKGVTVGCGLLAACIGILYAKQESLLYFPEIGALPRRLASNPRTFKSPSEYKIPFESHMIPCEDGVSIHSWLMLHPNSKLKDNPTLVFFHGNAGNIGYRLPNANQMYENLKANILMVEYRGYGNSDDTKPTEAGLKLDSEAALNFIMNHPKIDSKKVFIFGRSLGGAVAFHLAEYAEKKKIPIAGVIVENTFVSIAEMVDHIMPLVAPIKSLILRIGWDSGSVVPELKSPVLYLAGDDDQLVPHSHMQKLYELSRKSSIYTKMHIVNGGTHNETWVQGGRKYWEAMHFFIRTVIASQKVNNIYPSSDTIDSLDGEILNKNSENTVEVGMGTDTNKCNGVIPTMSNNFMGMAKDATSASGGLNNSKKKD
mmetsp:Transcript_7036/g.6674  ORF Transcript_7036/g.6674 Transcript_7036/m.6674 type:complete len:389 (-) Transcript_7036:93-1259(-)